VDETPLLSVQGLTTRFFTNSGVVRAVDNVSFQVRQGEAIGIVGESGSGKSVSALSILRLVPMPGKILGGKVLLRSRNLLELPESEMRQVRRHEIAMVFQDPSNFLNPIIRVGDQIAEAIAEPGNRREAVWRRVVEALQSVHIPEAARVAGYYPHQMSGGMQQRAVIAASIIRRPSLIIADEPTTALDATVQYQILKLLGELRSAIETALILISHDLAVIASICSRVYVMYAGQVVETGPTELIYSAPAHPYTRALLAAILDPLEKKRELTVLEGSIPDLVSPPPGCRFHPRCPMVMPICSQEEPPSYPVRSEQAARCWLYRS
jgi:oligopeptide/dipeptide ABC transporter ATP-binding protein